MIIKRRAIPYSFIMKCDNCGVQMNYSGQHKPNEHNQMMYQHICSICGRFQWEPKQYPVVEFVAVEE